MTDRTHDERLPGGIVTFLFTDVVDSTKLFRDLGDEFPPLLIAHNEILNQVWIENGGVKVRTEGDSFFVAFTDASDAIRAAVQGTEALAAHLWPAHAVLRSRMGMHTGVGYARGGDYIAYPVHQAARVGGVGHGGQVVVSPETMALASDLGDIELHDLGPFRVRDFDEPIHLFQAERAATPSAFPALRTESDARHNLGAPLPALRGRADDVAGIREQLNQSRVVSVVGPGGVGKTLLASTLARDLAPSFADGAWFVDLTSHTDASTLRGAIADPLSVNVSDLDGHLASSTMLLVLDNAEQAAAAVASLVVELVTTAPDVSILVTSREPLAIASERVWRLGLVDDDTAVDLFIERAAAAAHDRTFEPRRSDVAELCRRLDGLPLAIELAAARTSAMSVPEIIESLDDQLRLLRSRRRDFDERQRTMSGLIDWSYRLLDDDEQVVLRRLGAFSGSLDPESMVAICSDLGLDEFDVIDILWSLTEKSLVLPVVGDGTTRYRLLVTVRAFARDAMASAGELDDVQQQLGQWYRSIFDPRIPLTREAVSRLSDEIETLRVLTLELATVDAGLAQWLGWSLGAFYNLRDLGRAHAELAPLIELLSVEGEAVLGFLAIAANAAAKLGQLDRAEEMLGVANQLRTSMPAATIGIGSLANSATLLEVFRGDFEAGRAIAAGALPDADEIERLPLLQILGAIQSELGDLEAAGASFDEVRRIGADLGALDVEAVATGSLAEVKHRLGDMAEARALTGRALAVAQEAGLRAQAGFAIVGVARLTADAGHPAVAVRLHAAAERVLAETGQMLFGIDRELSEAMKASARETLGSAAFDQAEAEGAAMSGLDAFGQATDALELSAVL